MNSFTKTPVNTVIFDAVLALLLGLLAFAGEVAINAVFAISVTALYIACVYIRTSLFVKLLSGFLAMRFLYVLDGWEITSSNPVHSTWVS